MSFTPSANARVFFKLLIVGQVVNHLEPTLSVNVLHELGFVFVLRRRDNFVNKFSVMVVCVLRKDQPASNANISWRA